MSILKSKLFYWKEQLQNDRQFLKALIDHELKINNKNVYLLPSAFSHHVISNSTKCWGNPSFSEEIIKFRETILNNTARTTKSQRPQLVKDTFTTTTTTTKTTTTTSVTITACQSGNTGNRAIRSGAVVFGWTQVANSYIANKTQPYLSFGFVNDNQRQWWLDGVSVLDTTVPAGQLLNNPSFENVTSVIPGWTGQQDYCNANAAQIVTRACIVGSNCLQYFCGPENIYSFVGQYFAAIVVHSYNISYYLKTAGSGSQPTFCTVSIL